MERNLTRANDAIWREARGYRDTIRHDARTFIGLCVVGGLVHMAGVPVSFGTALLFVAAWLAINFARGLRSALKAARAEIELRKAVDAITSRIGQERDCDCEDCKPRPARGFSNGYGEV